jgi:hypothetical protein
MMKPNKLSDKKIGFSEFYQQHFQLEHSHPVNIVLHIVGTVLGILFIVLCVLFWPLYWLILFPVVHAVPGLIGHKLFERNLDVGDVRVFRKDFSPLWFIAANHVLTYQKIMKGIQQITSLKR